MTSEGVVGPGFELGSSKSSRESALKNVDCIHSEEIYCVSG